MAQNKKISELTAATALAGTEAIPVVQGGATKKATPSQLRTYMGLGVSGQALGVFADGATDDGPAIQSALNAASSAGGGVVYLPPGSCRIGQVISVPSNVTLSGDWAGTTIVVPASLTNKTIAGVAVNAAIAMVGATRAKVTRLKVDLRTNNSATNGIQIGEYGASSRSTDCEVSECSVIGSDVHKYLIYNKLADGTRVLDNDIEGIASGLPAQDVAGIEMFGGDGLLVRGNRVRRCAYGVLFKSEAGITGSYVKNSQALGNIIDGCVNGMAADATSSGDFDAVVLADNIVVESSNRGIQIGIASGATARDVHVVGNTIRNSGNSDLVVDQNAAATLAEGIVLAGNRISQDDNAISAIYLTRATNFLVQGNTVDGQPNRAIYLTNCTDGVVAGNDVSGAWLNAVYGGTLTRVRIVRNTLLDYGKNAADEGVFMEGSSECSVLFNQFKYAVAEDYAVYVHTDCSAVEVFGNTTTWTPSGAAFYNRASGAQRSGYFQAYWAADGSGMLSGLFPRPVAFGGSATDWPKSAVDVIAGRVRMRSPSPPASASATGNAGELAWDSSYIYVCTATDTWKRAAIATW